MHEYHSLSIPSFFIEKVFLEGRHNTQEVRVSEDNIEYLL